MELSEALDHARARRQGVIVSLKQSGRPHLANIVHTVGDDGLIRISTTDGRAKTNNLRRDQRVSLYVDRGDHGSFAVIEGTAELSPVATAPDDATVETLIEVYRALSGEHPDWDDYRAAMVRDHRLVVTIHPERAYGMWY